MIDLVFLLGAEMDIQTTFNRLEESQGGRGYLFMQTLDATLMLLRNNPQMGVRSDEPYRRLLMPRFPFGIFYEIQASRLVIAAIMDLRQSPKAIRRRLSGN